jgi:glycosyltransferase involved in cell wall biosynthesis
MTNNLKECGLKNVRYIPNFRQVPEISGKKSIPENGLVRFVFMSRIMPEKGVYEILECVDRLNGKSYKERYSVDFYGPVDESIRKEFEKETSEISNVKYKGILNLRDKDGYAILASYQAMLFPTFHHSEGIAGAIVDAFIAGIPVVTTDWRHNREVVTDNKTGIIVPVHDTDRLCEVMEDIICGKVDLDTMSKNAKKEAENYKAENIINKDFLKELGIL